VLIWEDVTWERGLGGLKGTMYSCSGDAVYDADAEGVTTLKIDS
jgi:hypothetical protein